MYDHFWNKFCIAQFLIKNVLLSTFSCSKFQSADQRSKLTQNDGQNQLHAIDCDPDLELKQTFLEVILVHVRENVADPGGVVLA